jgi:hypothetical protein
LKYIWSQSLAGTFARRCNFNRVPPRHFAELSTAPHHAAGGVRQGRAPVLGRAERERLDRRVAFENGRKRSHKNGQIEEQRPVAYVDTGQCNAIGSPKFFWAAHLPQAG